MAEKLLDIFGIETSLEVALPLFILAEENFML